MFEGSRSQNSSDTLKYRKNTKLNEEKVRQLKEEISKTDFSERGSASRFDKKMARVLNVSSDTISEVRRGDTFKIYGDNTFKRSTQKSVVQLDLDGNLVAKYSSIKEAAQILRPLTPKSAKVAISRTCSKKQKTYANFIWMSLEDYMKLNNTKNQ